MYPKQVFWIGAKGGLCEEKHYRCMRDAVWLFLWLLLRQTGVNEIGEGIVNYGHPITRTQIQIDTGYHERRVENWIDLLRRTGYVRTEWRGKNGIIFFVQNAKDKQRKRCGKRETALVLESPKKGTMPLSPSPKKGIIPEKGDSQTITMKEVKSVPTSPNPKDLSYSNKDAGANSAPELSVASLAREKAVPRSCISETEWKARARKQIADLDRWVKDHQSEAEAGIRAGRLTV